MNDPNSTKLELRKTGWSLNKFLKVIETKGPQLRELIFHSHIPGITNRANIWTCVPELKVRKISLFLEFGLHCFLPPLHYGREFLCELFKACPYLESLILKSNYDSEDNEYRILRWLVESKIDGVGNIKELDIEKANPQTIELIASKFTSASLQKLILNAIDDKFDDKIFSTILEAHKTTLKHLKFSFTAGYHDQIQFPEMIALNKLEFGSYYGSIPEPFFVWETIQGNTFPNLVTLNLIDEIAHFCRPHSYPGTRLFDTEELFPEDGMPIWTLRNLSLPAVLTVKGLQRAKKLFPGVKRLCLGPQRPEVIQELWNTWTDTMEILTISLNLSEFLPNMRSTEMCPESSKFGKRVASASCGASVTNDIPSYDSVITGLPETFINEIQDNFKRDGKFPYSKVSTLFKNRTSISNLKKLTHLHIHTGSRPGTWNFSSTPSSSKFTDISFKLGFGQLPMLEFFSISSQVVQVSRGVINEICKKLGLREVSNGGLTVNLVKSTCEIEAKKLLNTGMGVAFPFQSIPEFME